MRTSASTGPVSPASHSVALLTNIVNPKGGSWPWFIRLIQGEKPFQTHALSGVHANSKSANESERDLSRSTEMDRGSEAGSKEYPHVTVHAQ